MTAVIPSRNGLELLMRQLPLLLDRDVELEVLVVDDCSEDGTSDELPRRFPSVRVLRRNGTPGFCHAVNLGFEESETGFVLLLNNDVAPEPGCIPGMVSDLAAAPARTVVTVPRITRPDGSDDGAYGWGFRRGLAYTAPGAENPYPSGACALWRSSAWAVLGGLSADYAPIYWEDADMGARMKGLGMSMARFEGPGAFHDHAATMGGSLGSMTLRERNRFIFMDRWCRTPARRFATLLWLPLHLAFAAATGNRAFPRGFRDYIRWRRDR